jgi:predicted N-acetyltransferase YhbS
MTIPTPAIDGHAATGSGQILYRRMDEADTDAYCRLFQAVFAAPPWNETWPLQKIRRGIAALMRKKGFIGILAEGGGASVGFIAGSRLRFLPKVFYIAELFVNNEVRGRGVGSGLLRELTAGARENGFSKLLLLTKPDSSAEEFYRRAGFGRWLSPVRLGGKCVLRREIGDVL